MPTFLRPSRPQPPGSAAPDLDAQLTAARRAEPDAFRQDLRVAAVVLVGGVGLLVIGLTGLWGGGDSVDPDRWWHLGPLVLGTGVMLVKRRWPLPALCAGVVLTVGDVALGGSLGMLVVLVDLLYSAALFATRAGRRVLVVTAWVLVGVAAGSAGVSSGGDARAVVAGAIQAVGFVVVPLWWAANVRQKSELALLADERAALARAHADGLERIAELSRHEAVQAERRTMARDLHDVVAGHVSAIAIRSGAALASPPGRERASLEAVRASSLTALDEMRAMILLLRADGPTDGPVSAPGTLDELGAVVAAHVAAGARVELDDRTPSGLPAAVEQAALRIVQEALTNASRHGGPGTVRVVLQPDAAALEVSVLSPLGGTPRGRGSGTGVLGMRERAEILGGSLAAGPSDDGWLVRALLPTVLPAGLPRPPGAGCGS